MRQDEFVLDCLSEFDPMLARLANRVNMDLEDLRQEAALLILRTLPKIPAGVRPEAYLNVVVRGRLRGLASKRISTLSLDLPISNGSDIMLADVLPEPPQVSHERHDRRVEALYKALHRLSRVEQDFLKRRFELHGFRPHAREYGRLTTSVRRKALRKLQQDVILQMALK